MKLEDLKLYQECLNLESTVWKIVEKWEGFNKETVVISFVTASYAISASVEVRKEVSSSYADTASYVETAQTASFVTTAQTASFVTGSNVYGPHGSNSIISSRTSVDASEGADEFLINRSTGLAKINRSTLFSSIAGLSPVGSATFEGFPEGSIFVVIFTGANLSSIPLFKWEKAKSSLFTPSGFAWDDITIWVANSFDILEE